MKLPAWRFAAIVAVVLLTAFFLSADKLALLVQAFR